MAQGEGLGTCGDSSSSVALLSEIANSSNHGEDSPYFAGWKAHDQDPYDSVSNPSGVIQMGLAENQVSFDLLEEYLEQHPEAHAWGDESSHFREDALFQDYHGLEIFRKAMASFMEQIRGGRAKFDPDRIVLTAGATAANELITFVLANPGDALLIPTPYYPGFDRDLRWRTGVHIIPVHCTSANGFQITPEAMEEAFARAEAARVRVRGLLLTNPSNPLGKAIARDVLEKVLDFVVEKNIHLISDEIYSGSVFSPEAFTSVAEIAGDGHRELVHVVYSLSKDLGLPGFRVGIIYSCNDAVVKAARRMSSFTLVSSHTQRMLAAVLSDGEFTDGYLKRNRERLKARCEMMVRGIESVGAECLQGTDAGLFCWLNLRPWLDEDSREGELRLWHAVLRDCKLNISPGSSCHCVEAGWFRVCFANMSVETLQVALKRMHDFAKNMKELARAPSSADRLQSLQEFDDDEEEEDKRERARIRTV